ncbi:MAG: hypothetical protein CHACPFDD_02016 [Phycisphaerae bacterium]|nr:hypothetical protein [Phycisphaerae bacterium]
MVRNKATTYAILAVVEIARRDRGGAGGVRAKEIADIFKLPAAYAAKVMTQLSRHGVLLSGRGPRGGFRLARGPEAINFLEIVEAVEGLGGEEAVAEVSSEMRQVESQIARLFDRALAELRRCLKQVTLAEFLRELPASRPANPADLHAVGVGGVVANTH